MNVLINAYACRPNSGSEGGMTWRWIEGLAKQGVQAYVITEGEWREDIEKALTASPYQHLIHFYFNPVSERIRKMCWNQGDYRFYYYYRKWQKKTLKIAESIIKDYQIDIIHQLSMIGFREPGYLWKIKGIPYVWGPIGGMSYVPMKYICDAKWTTKAKYFCKNIISKCQFRFSPRVNKSFNKAEIIVSANQDSYLRIKKRYSEKKVVLINETGCSDIDISGYYEKSDESFDILWVGRFIPTKLLGMALSVIKELRDLPNLRFHVVGLANDEKVTESYHKIAKKKGINDNCYWYGWLSHEEVQDLMKKVDVLFFSSVVEGTPHVVLEAISNNLPVVCFDTCGQGDVINENVGIKIPLSNPDRSIQQFSKVFRELYYNRTKLNSLSRNCNVRKHILSWDNKVNKIICLYEELLVGKR